MITYGLTHYVALINLSRAVYNILLIYDFSYYMVAGQWNYIMDIYGTFILRCLSM